jgi:hypothetical protein
MTPNRQSWGGASSNNGANNMFLQATTASRMVSLNKYNMNIGFKNESFRFSI